MTIVLAAMLLFVGTGLVSERVGWRQTAFVVLVSALLAALQVSGTRFL